MQERIANTVAKPELLFKLAQIDEDTWTKWIQDIVLKVGTKSEQEAILRRLMEILPSSRHAALSQALLGLSCAATSEKVSQVMAVSENTDPPAANNVFVSEPAPAPVEEPVQVEEAGENDRKAKPPLQTIENLRENMAQIIPKDANRGNSKAMRCLNGHKYLLIPRQLVTILPITDEAYRGLSERALGRLIRGNKVLCRDKRGTVHQIPLEDL